MNCKCADRLRLAIVTGLIAAMVAVACPVAAQPLARVVSINLCTDQLVLALADPGQIAGLGRFARHVEMSYLAGRAAAYPALRGNAEEVMRLRPDLVLAGAYSGRATRMMLAAHNVRVETFVPPRSIVEAKSEVERVASLLGQVARGAGLIAEIDAAVTAAASVVANRRPVSALAIQRRGYASGRDTLLSAAMTVAGFANAADALGIAGIARAPLETIVKLKPEVLVLEDLGVARDQSTALLQHPVLVQSGLGMRVVRLPVAEATCAGPALPALIRRLAQQLQ